MYCIHGCHNSGNSGNLRETQGILRLPEKLRETQGKRTRLRETQGKWTKLRETQGMIFLGNLYFFYQNFRLRRAAFITV